MLKPVSFLVIALFGVISVFPGNAAQMTPQIQELLRQKEEKAKQLEACDGKRKAWMIAGISTIGLTAVGVGVNIAQANKSKKLDTDLKNRQTELDRINVKLGNGGSSGTLDFFPDVSSLFIDAEDYCCKSISGDDLGFDDEEECPAKAPGDFAVKFSYGIVKGISACSDVEFKDSDTDPRVAKDQDRVQRAYKSSTGAWCYCKITGSKNSKWIPRYYDQMESQQKCEEECSEDCAALIYRDPGFRKVFFDTAD